MEKEMTCSEEWPPEYDPEYAGIGARYVPCYQPPMSFMCSTDLWPEDLDDDD